MGSRTKKNEVWEVPVWLLTSCVLLLIIAILGQTWWSIAQDKALTLATANKNSLLNLRILEEHANRILHDAARATVAVAEELQTKNDANLKDEASVRTILSNQRRDSQFISALALVDRRGMLWASSLRFPIEQVDLSKNDHISYLNQSVNAYQKTVRLGSPYLPKKSQQAILPLARNVFDSSGQSIGQVQAEINLSYFQEFYERVAKDAGAKISLYDKDAQVIVQAMSQHSSFKPEVDADVALNLKNSFAENGRYESTLIGADRLTSYAYLKMKDFPLVVVIGRDLDMILLEWHKRMQQSLLFAGLAILVSLLLAALLFKKVKHLKQSREKLSDSERRYRLLFQDAQDGILLIDRSYHFVDGNQNALEMLAVDSKADLYSLDIGEFSADWRYTQPTVAAKKAESIKKFVDLAFKGKVQKFEWIAHRRGKDWFSEVTLSRIKISSEPIIFCVMRDISQRKHAEKLLQGQNQLLQLIGSSESLESILIDTCHFVEKNNPHWHCGVQLLSLDQRLFTQTIGHHFPEILRRQLTDAPVCHGNGVWSEAVLEVVPVWTQEIPKSPAMEFIAQRKLLANYAAVGSWPIMGKTGLILGTFTLFTESSAALSNEDLSLISIATDVSSIAIEGKRAEEKAIRLAHYDEVTKLPNRFLFSQYLAKSLMYAQASKGTLAVFMLDLDRFKAINDSFDHEAGDQVLREISARLRASISESDTLARVGGDEFMLFLDRDKSPRELTDIADRLLHSASTPFMVQGQELQISASIGIAMYPDDGRDAQVLMKNSEIAMYRAKHNGKNNYQFYDPNMNVHTVERLAYEAQLRKALENREFVVYYQPKVSVVTGKVVGAEALVRWNRPDSGLVFPSEFIGLAEESGLIGRLGMQILDMVCRDVANFRSAGKEFGRIAINLSGAQFSDDGLLRELSNVINFWEIPSSAIEFEITESMVMQNHERAIAHMDDLKAAGFTLSIDDFGTGYSSLAYLKRFPVDNLKIDRSFIMDIPADPNDTAIVKAIVAMAKTLGLKVVAEGVENAVQLQTLVTAGCDEYQGFYYSKAIPQQEFFQLL
ncbi:bifunctional diguanylate cyclase/phosphodiesterase [Undibacterium fentianense]|uniref:EAL domain-containing protein n=1 Tax=Undibacterium fentianense TaxID=2828728 RepID=A0A941IEQ1_9BURK|nr:EAL domain-containing protein [Undibacterium fentianense]MBR7799622.1 EAL domain-containing protein [Undibacterium fentianense]